MFNFIKEKLSLGKIAKNSKLSIYNPYSSSLYSVNYKSDNLEDKFNIVPAKKQKYSKNTKMLSFISNSDFVFDTIEVSKNIPDDEIEDALFNIIYEELDNSIEYNIIYDEIKKDDDDKSEFRDFNIFIVEPNIIKYLSNGISRSISYIDRLYPMPLLFKSLYQFSKSFDKTDCFVYVSRDGTSLNLLKNGQLVYTKVLTFSTIIFFELFTESLNESGDYNLFYTEFKNVVTAEQEFAKDKKYKRALTNSLHVLFEEIDDVLHYIKRNFNIEEIDNIYYSSKIGKILGVSEYSKALLGENSFDGFLSEFSISYPENLDEIHYLIYLTYQLNSSSTIYLDILKAPPSFFTRPSGHILLATAGATILALAYPLFNHYQASEIDLKEAEKVKKERALYLEYTTRRTLLDKLYKEESGLKIEKNRYKIKYEKRIHLLEEIYSRRNNYTMKGKAISEITEKLNKHSVKISSLDYVIEDKKSFFRIWLIAKDDEMITSLLRTIINNYDIYADSIEIDEISRMYKSELKIIDKNQE